MISPVKMPLIIRNRSHGRRFFASVNTFVFMYSFSDGRRAAIFSMSSVASS